MDDKVLVTMRRMAWERAKGELSGLLQTYWGEGQQDENRDTEFDRMDRKICAFIKDVEGNW